MVKITYAINERGHKIRIGGTLSSGKTWMRAYNKNFGRKHKGRAIVAVVAIEKKPRRKRQRIGRFGLSSSKWGF